MLSLFFCYATEDQVFYRKLEDHLSMMKRQGLIESWSDMHILAGDVVQTHVQEAIAKADIALLLVSPYFLAAEPLYVKQLDLLMVRQNSGSLVVIPVLVRSVEGWKHSKFGHLAAVPRSEKPISLWEDRDEAYADVAGEIRLVIKKRYNEMPTSQLTSSVTDTLAPYLSTILKQEYTFSQKQSQTEDEHYQRAEKLWQVLSTRVSSDLALAGASYLFAAKPEAKEMRDQFQMLLTQALQQSPDLAKQLRDLLGSQQIIQRVLADTGSKIKDVEQGIEDAQGTINQAVEAHDKSSVTGIKQNVNTKKRKV